MSKNISQEEFAQYRSQSTDSQCKSCWLVSVRYEFKPRGASEKNTDEYTCIILIK